MRDAPTTTSAPPSQPHDPRYPRPIWLRAIRWLFLHWWLIPLAYAIILILIYLLDRPSLNQLLPFLTQYWWILTLSLIVVIFLLRGAYTWADSDDKQESNVLRQRRQRELEQQRRQLERQRQLEQQQRQRALEQQPPPAPGFKLHHPLRGHTDATTQIACSPPPLLTRPSASGTPRPPNPSTPSPATPVMF